MVKTKELDEQTQWLVDELEAWETTFTEPDEPCTLLSEIIQKLHNNEELTKKEYKEVVFHLWQKLS